MDSAVAYRLNNDWSNRLISDLMRDFGLSLGAAQGLTGALAMESKGFNDWTEDQPMVLGSRGGFGMAQWTGPRRRAFEQYAKKMGLNPNGYEAQYGYLREELNGVGGHDMGAMRQLLKTEDPRVAAQITTNIFLRPGIPHMNARMDWTDQVVSAYAPFTDKLSRTATKEDIDLAQTAEDAVAAMAGIGSSVPQATGIDLRIQDTKRSNKAVITTQGMIDPPTPRPRSEGIAARTQAELDKQDQVLLPELADPINAPIWSTPGVSGLANQNKRDAKSEQSAASGRRTSTPEPRRAIAQPVLPEVDSPETMMQVLQATANPTGTIRATEGSAGDVKYDFDSKDGWPIAPETGKRMTAQDQRYYPAIQQRDAAPAETKRNSGKFKTSAGSPPIAPTNITAGGKTKEGSRIDGPGGKNKNTEGKTQTPEEVILTELIDDGIAITQSGAPLPAGADARDRAREEAAKKGGILDSKGGMLTSDGDLVWEGFLDPNIGLGDKIKGGLIGAINDVFGFDIRMLDGTPEQRVPRPEGYTAAQWYDHLNQESARQAREKSGRGPTAQEKHESYGSQWGDSDTPGSIAS